MFAESWSWEEEKAFENALAVYHDDTGSNWWEKIAAVVPGKTSKAIKNHYDILVEDIRSIESGLVPLPNYTSPSSSSSTAEGSDDCGGNGKIDGNSHGDSGYGLKGSRLDYERRKGIAWTEEEHRLFLLGLDKYGKGDWRSISRNFVISRTPTQVASHAQKYFIRLNSMNKDRRRSSIHDITNAKNADIPASHRPITGQCSNNCASGSSEGNKPHSLTIPAAHGNAVYGDPLMPVIGTSLAGLPMAYGFQPPPIATVVAGRAPVRLATPNMSCPMYNSLC